MTGMGRTAVTAGIALLNFVFFGLGFLVAARIFYVGRWRPLALVVFFLVMGAVARLWSAKWWTVVVPSAVGYFWGMGGRKWAIHLTDTRGEYAPPMWEYMLRPSVPEAIWGLVAVAAAAIGWWAMGRLWTARPAAGSAIRA
jgi:hypothetical protein